MNISDEYFAGLFDGEGWIMIQRAAGKHYRAKREWAFQCMAALTIREEFLVLELQKRFGGTVNLQKSRSDKHSPYYKWQITGMNALKFAEEMKDLLILKKPHAELLIEFQKQKIENGNKPLPDWRYEFYEKCFDGMKAFNQKGVSKNVR